MNGFQRCRDGSTGKGEVFRFSASEGGVVKLVLVVVMMGLDGGGYIG